jgi:hypothetical protein
LGPKGHVCCEFEQKIRKKMWSALMGKKERKKERKKGKGKTY